MEMAGYIAVIGGTLLSIMVLALPIFRLARLIRAK